MRDVKMIKKMMKNDEGSKKKQKDDEKGKGVIKDKR
jgi:hypothetical protein